MAKELPYFQFEPAQYLTGNIQFCSLEAQGLFINICAIYWQRECGLTLNQILKKFNKNDLINELIDNEVIKTDFDNIIIEFLDEQFETITKSKSRLSEAGRKGALIKKQATLKPPLSKASTTLKQPDKIREDKTREDNIDFNLFWNLYPKKIARAKCEPKWNKLTFEQQTKIISTLPNFIKYKPFETYTHPNPETYLNQERWNDEIVINNQNNETDLDSLSKDDYILARRKAREEYDKKTNPDNLCN